MEILWFGFFEFFLRNDPIVVLVEIFEDLSEVLWSLFEELIGDVIFAVSDGIIVVNIESFQELSGNFFFGKTLDVGIMSKTFNITDTGFDGIKY